VRFIILGAAIVMAGCATNSGIIEPRGNQFMLARQAATGFNSTSQLQAEVMRDAAMHCKAMGKTFKVLSETRTTGAPILGNFPHAEVRFECADKPA
jgi:hypothetical protein